MNCSHRYLLFLVCSLWAVASCTERIASTVVAPDVQDVPAVADVPPIDVDVPSDTNSTDGTDIAPDTPPLCSVGEKRCLTDTIVQTCMASGTAWEESTCGEEDRCFEGTCGPVVCVPDEPSPLCPSPAETAQCNNVGTGFIITPCETGNTCFEGQCVDYLCPPGTVTCWSMHAVQMCRDDGSGWDIIEVCEPGGQCDQGVCLDPCTVAEQTQRTLGCSFVVTPMDTGDDESIANGLAITLPLNANLAECTVQDEETGEILGDPFLIEPGESVTVPLPAAPPQVGSSKSKKRYRVVSNTPIALEQLMPFPSETVPIHDATPVFPANTPGREFIVTGWPSSRVDDQTHVGWINIVATATEPTTVWVVPRTELAAGPVGSGLVASKPNQPFSFTLQPNEVAHLEPAAVEGSDLTGTHIRSDQNVAVFSGHECVRVPDTLQGCHAVAEQLPPVSMWGTQVLALPFAPRSDTAVDLWRVVAGAENVQIETHPPQPGYTSLTLPKGGYITLSASEPFAITASGPILVTQWMTGAAYPGHNPTCDGTGLGGPAMVVVSPVEQFSRKGALMKAIDLETNALNLVIPPDTKVWIDDTLLKIDENTPSVGGWSLVQHSLSLGAHTVEASRRIGMTAYAYGCDASFAYSAGQRLRSVYEEAPCLVSTTPPSPEVESTDCTLLYPDIDGDGAGATGFGACLCAPEGAYQVPFGGDCDDYDPLINSWVPESCNGIDDNCNDSIDEGCDDDNDGWCDDQLVVVGLPAICPNGGGDCMDYSALVSPESMEIPANNLDDDCDGLTDDQLPTNAKADCNNLPCVGHTLQSALCSLEICFGPDTVEDVSITSPTDSPIDEMWDAVAHFGTLENDLSPRAGSSYLILSSGQATGTDHNQDLGGQSISDPYPKFPHQMLDAARLQLTLTAPDGATGFSVDSVFLSSEFEESIGSASSDKFYILLQAPQTTSNETIVINHTPCLNESWNFDLPTETGFNCFMSVNSIFGESCAKAMTNIDGTGYECDNATNAGGSSTGWLQNRWTIQPGETFTLTFLIHDTADGNDDSSVILDNFHWESGGTNPEVIKIDPEPSETAP